MDKPMDGRTLIWISLLTFAAGFANGDALLGSLVAVSHQTGNLSQLSLALAAGEASLAALYLGLAASFFVGSVLAGVIFHQAEIGRSSRYGLFSLVSGLLLILTPLLLPTSWAPALHLFAALSLGLQNGILKPYRGAPTRTTHMTGYLTDAGVALGERLRGRRDQKGLAGYYLLHVFLFVAGSLSAALLRPICLRYTTTLVGLLQLLCGLYYLLFVAWTACRCRTRSDGQ